MYMVSDAGVYKSLQEYYKPPPKNVSPEPKVARRPHFCYYRSYRKRACSSVVERCPDKTEVHGSIPCTRTKDRKPALLQVFCLLCGGGGCRTRTRGREPGARKFRAAGGNYP